jgi:hypothetical protein
MPRSCWWRGRVVPVAHQGGSDPARLRGKPRLGPCAGLSGPAHPALRGPLRRRLRGARGGLSVAGPHPVLDRRHDRRTRLDRARHRGLRLLAAAPGDVRRLSLRRPDHPAAARPDRGRGGPLAAPRRAALSAHHRRADADHGRPARQRGGQRGARRPRPALHSPTDNQPSQQRRPPDDDDPSQCAGRRLGAGGLDRDPDARHGGRPAEGRHGADRAGRRFRLVHHARPRPPPDGGAPGRRRRPPRRSRPWPRPTSTAWSPSSSAPTAS